MTPEAARVLIQEEIFTLLHSCAEATLARLRHERLTALSHQPVARQLLENPLAVPHPGFRPPSPAEPSAFLGLPTAGQPGNALSTAGMLWHVDAPRATSPAEPRTPAQPRTRRHLMLRPPVSVAIEPGGPRRSVIVPDDTPVEKTGEAQAATLWERLEGDG
jgi:hypothetical protein